MISLIPLAPRVSLLKRSNQIELIEFLIPVFKSSISHLLKYCRQPELLFVDCTIPTNHSFTTRTDKGEWVMRLKGWGDPYHTPLLFGHELAHYFMRSIQYVPDRTKLKSRHFPIEEIIATLAGLKAVEFAENLFQRDRYKPYLDHTEAQRKVRNTLMNQAIPEKYCNLASVPLSNPLSGEPDYVNIEILAFGIYPVFQSHPRLWEILPHVLTVLTSLDNPSWEEFLSRIEPLVSESCRSDLQYLKTFLYS